MKNALASNFKKFEASARILGNCKFQIYILNSSLLYERIERGLIRERA